MGRGGAGEDLDAMHQLLHIKLKWKLTERELEHIERVFTMFDVPAVGAIDRKAFPYTMRRLRFADKSKRRGSWASQAVIKEVLSGEYPAYAKGESELSYLAYVDAVGRAKDEIINGGEETGVGDTANALQQLTMSFGGFLGGGDEAAAAAPAPAAPTAEDNKGDGGIWAKSVESVSKKQLAQASSVFQQALKGSTSTVNGPRRITRRDLNPVLCAIKPGLTDGDVQVLCELSGVSGRTGCGFSDVVVMVGYAELASHTLGGISQLAKDVEAEAEAKEQAVEEASKGGMFGMALESFVDSSSALGDTALGAARTLPGAGQLEAGIAANSTVFEGVLESTMASAASAASAAQGGSSSGFSAGAAAAAASGAMGGVTDLASGAMGGVAGAAAGGVGGLGGLGGGLGGGGGAHAPKKNKRVALKDQAVKEAEEEKRAAETAAAAAKAAAAESSAAQEGGGKKAAGGGAGKGSGGRDSAAREAQARLKAATLALDPVYKRQMIGNWFSERAGSATTAWRQNLKQVFDHYDTNRDGLIDKPQFLLCVDELELDLDDDESLQRFQEVDVDDSGELSLDEFERLFEALIKEWRAQEDAMDVKIQEQYKPLLTLYEPDEGIFGNNGDGPRKGFLLLMARNGHEFWSERSMGEAQAAGHWAARLGFDDAREAFELAAAYQTDGRFVGGAVGTKVSRLAMLRFVRANCPKSGGSVSDTEFQELVWDPHVVKPLSSGAGSKNVALDDDNLEMDLTGFRSFCNDSVVVRHFQSQVRAKRQQKGGGPGGGKQSGGATTAAASAARGSVFGSMFGGGGDAGAAATGAGSGGDGSGDGELNEERIKEAFNAVDLDGSGDLDIEEVSLLLTAELNMDLSEDEIHALFLRHDDNLTESVDLKGFQGLMKDAMRLLEASPEEREQELLGWGSRVDKEQSAKRQQAQKAKKAKGYGQGVEDKASRTDRDAWRKLHRKASFTQNTAGNEGSGGGKQDQDSKAELAGLKEEMEARLHGVDGQPAIGTKGMHEEEKGGGQDASGEGWDDDAYERFDAGSTMQQEGKRVLTQETNKAAADALEATKLALVGNQAAKKSYADIKADLDEDLMQELTGIYEKCLNSVDADGLDVGGFVIAMRELRLDLPDWRVKETFEEYDDDGNGSLDFEEFVELAAMKLVEKWTAKGGKAFAASTGDDDGGGGGAGGSGGSSAVKTNARRQLSVGEIMGEVMDNKKNVEYDRAKSKFHVEEILLIEEAFIAQAEPHSRRGKVNAVDLPKLCLRMGMCVREHDLALLAADADPLDTRYVDLPNLVVALADKPQIWRKVDGQLADYRGDQEVLSEEQVASVNTVFKRCLRHKKTDVAKVPLMESKLVPAAFRLLGFVLEPGLSNLWVMELLLGHDQAADASHAEATVYEYEEEAHALLEEKRAAAADPGAVKPEPLPDDILVAKMEAAAAKKARRWITFGDLLNLVGRYLHDTVDVDEEVVTVTKTGFMDLEVKTTDVVTKTVPRAVAVAEEEKLPPSKRKVALASSYHIAYDTIMMAESLFSAVDKEQSGAVAAYQLKIMFRRLSWRIGVKPSAVQIDDMVSNLGFSVGGSTAVTLYDWLFMVEYLSFHRHEDSFFGQYGRAIAAFGYMDEGGAEDEAEFWEQPPAGGYSETMSTVKVQGLDTAKEKVKVRSVKRMVSYKKGDQAPVPGTSASSPFGDDDEDGWGGDNGQQKEEGGSSDEEEEEAPPPLVFPSEKEELDELVAKGAAMSAEEKQRVQELMQFLAAEEELSALLAKGPANLTPEDTARVKELMGTAAVWAKKRKERQRKLQEEHDKKYHEGRKKKSKKSPKKGMEEEEEKDEEEEEKQQQEGEQKRSKLRPPSFDDKEGDQKDGGEAFGEEEEEDDEREEVNTAFARAEAQRANALKEHETDRTASQAFAKFSAAGRNGSPNPETEGFVCGQRVLVQALGQCGLNPSKDLRVALLVDAFIQAVLALPQNVAVLNQASDGSGGGGGAGAVLVDRTQFLRLIEQGRRFGARQRRVGREDLEPEEIFIISDPLAHG